MCQTDHQTQNNPPDPSNAATPFPWHAGIFDAHCHPTDVMALTEHLPDMRASVLTIMATRSQDQHLVAEVAAKHGLQGGVGDVEDLRRTGEVSGAKVIPSFGWHPWFSHQLYDDSLAEPSYNPSAHSGDEEAAKRVHYQAVLSPPPEDPSFIASLPSPRSISSFIGSSLASLTTHPHALVGEIGLDKASRLPQSWESSEETARDATLTPGTREGRLLSPYRVQMSHQQVVLSAQLALAGKEGRPVSVHGVQAHGVLYETIAKTWKGCERRVISRREQKMIAPGAEEDSSSDDERDDAESQSKRTEKGRPYPPRICLHSFSGSPQTLVQYFHPSIPARVYVSFSTAVNFSSDASRAKLSDVVRAVPDDRLLVESDLHTAGKPMDAALEDMYRRVCDIKSWDLQFGVERIGRNYTEFVWG